MAWSRAWSWQDVAAKGAASKAFQPSKAAERRYATQVRGVGREVGRILQASPDAAAARHQLKRYTEAIKPWAEQTAANMVRDCARHNEQGWRAAAQHWGIDIRGMLAADISKAVNEKISDNIKLITSLPQHAAERVGELARQAVENGTRAETLAKQIAAQGDVAMSRARTIAATEISKTGTALTSARAQAVGSEGYIWRTTRDGNRRPSHAAMEGRYVRWDQPPTLDGMTGHAGEFPNCRCYPEPVVPEASGRTSPSPMPTQAEEAESGEHKLRSRWEQESFGPITPHAEGMPLHNPGRAEFAMDKLTRYSMDPDSPRGRSKARVWRAALGMDKRHAEDVRRQVLEQLDKRPAFRDLADKHGERFKVVVPVTGPNGRTVDVTTSWIYERGSGRTSTKPRLVTCYVGRE